MPWVEALHNDVPELSVFDAHVHIGLKDPGGLLAVQDEVLDAHDQLDARALIFPLKEPDGYTLANQHLIDLANERPHQVRALVRVDPADHSTRQARDGLDRGAVGVKLHPRGEGFSVSDDRLNAVFVMADERRLPVMIQAGGGDPAVGTDALDRADTIPEHG